MVAAALVVLDVSAVEPGAPPALRPPARPTRSEPPNMACTACDGDGLFGGRIPRWTKPKQAENARPRMRLMVANTLSNTKEEFVLEDGSNTVRWYICGPTVYDRCASCKLNTVLNRARSHYHCMHVGMSAPRMFECMSVCASPSILKVRWKILSAQSCQLTGLLEIFEVKA